MRRAFLASAADDFSPGSRLILRKVASYTPAEIVESYTKRSVDMVFFFVGSQEVVAGYSGIIERSSRAVRVTRIVRVTWEIRVAPRIVWGGSSDFDCLTMLEFSRACCRAWFVIHLENG